MEASPSLARHIWMQLANITEWWLMRTGDASTSRVNDVLRMTIVAIRERVMTY